MKIDTDKMTTHIMKAVKEKMETKSYPESTLGFAQMCNICGNGSISFCPWTKIKNILQNPPKDTIIKS